jgi:hypothetical protein
MEADGFIVGCPHPVGSGFSGDALLAIKLGKLSIQ